MNSNYVSIEHIIEKVNRELPPGGEFNLESVKEWIWEAMEEIGCITQYAASTFELDIVDSKAETPSAIQSIQEVLEGESSYTMKQINQYDNFGILTYKLNAGYIYTSFEEGTVLIHCYTMPVDANTNPIVPDDSSIVKGVVSHIIYKISKQLWFKDLLTSDKYQYIVTQWTHDIMEARGASKMPTVTEYTRLQQDILKPFPDMYRNEVTRTNIVVST